MRRTFIVGCPRSGTTIVQAMLARHPDVLTLPETALFEHLYGQLHWRWGDHGARHRRRRWQQFGFARKTGRRVLHRLQLELGAADTLVPLQLEACIDRFVRLLDDHAARAGRSLWIEKTPNHLLYIPEIERHVPDAHFVHVIRSGLDVVASITDANLRYDDNHGFHGDAKLWANRWNRAVTLHNRYVDHPRHHFVFLDEFLHDTGLGWLRLCHALGLDAEAPLAAACPQPIANPAVEPWKRQAMLGTPRASRSKAGALFGPELLDWLSGRLVELDPLRERCLGAAEPTAPVSRPPAAGAGRSERATTDPA